jgi:hypothetical protein
MVVWIIKGDNNVLIEMADKIMTDVYSRENTIYACLIKGSNNEVE